MVDHDRLFKELLTTFFVEFLELFLPELAAQMEAESVVFLDKEVFTDVTSGQRHEVDLLVQARLRGQESCFLVHVENQAQVQPDFAKRMFRYFGRIHEKHDMPIYPIALFSHDSHRPEPGYYEVRISEWSIMRFEFQVIQLHQLSWRTFMRQANPVAAALMARMGMADEERARVKLECLRLLTTLRLNRARQRLISGFIDTYLQLNREEALQFAEEIDTLLTSDEKDQVMELTTSWKEEGRQQGRQEGEAKVVLRLLQLRCRELTPEIHARVSALPVEKLEDLAEALLGFRSAADLESWLESR